MFFQPFPLSHQGCEDNVDLDVLDVGGEEFICSEWRLTIK
jgi:hypothetical protein